MDQQTLVERAGRGDHDAFAVLAGAAIGRLEVLIDPGTGEVRTTPWNATSDPAWQRRAP